MGIATETPPRVLENEVDSQSSNNAEPQIAAGFTPIDSWEEETCLGCGRRAIQRSRIGAPYCEDHQCYIDFCGGRN